RKVCLPTLGVRQSAPLKFLESPSVQDIADVNARRYFFVMVGGLVRNYCLVSDFQQLQACRTGSQRLLNQVASSRHLMEQPMDEICLRGPWPVSAISFMALNRSRVGFGLGVISR